MFEPGTQVRLKGADEVGVVVRVLGSGQVQVRFADGLKFVSVDDLEIVEDDDPTTLIQKGRIGEPEGYALRLQALYLQHSYRHDPVSGLSNARIEPQLHQVFVAHRVIEKVYPRMILADEVGLGKTIEAGLIIKELRARGLAGRVLVVCPASLQYQWQTELRTKFNEEFEIIDGAAARVWGRGGTNPFLRHDSVICSLTFAVREERADQIAHATWDMVVFDEAHRVRRWLQGARRTTTKAYELAERLRDDPPGLLLLSATPMQLHPFELYSLIELVEPGLFPSYEAYDRTRLDLPRLNGVMKGLRSWPVLGEEDRASFLDEHYLQIQELGIPRGREPESLDDHDTRSQLMDELAEKHPLAGVVVRNRKVEIGGFTKRSAEVVEVRLSEQEAELYHEVTEYIREGYDRAIREKNNAVGFLMVLYQKMLTSSSYALRKSLRGRLTKLQALLKEARKVQVARRRTYTELDLEELSDAEELSGAVDELEAEVVDIDALQWEIDTVDRLVRRLGAIRDSKAAALLDRIERIQAESPGRKMLIFTQFLATQEFVAGVLTRNGFSVATFNGRMRLEEKERQVRVFRDEAQVMVTTEAGGEGRNFQFAHIMFNYDLPWNPMKVEQRIGRLDRIGQRYPVLIYNLASLDTVEERILDVLDNRIRLFEESVGSLEPILGQVEADITRLVVAGPEDFESEIERYAEDLERRVREAREQERVMADFALDRASFRRDKANELLDRPTLASASDLRGHIERMLRHYGGRLDPHPDGGDSLALSPRLGARLGTRGSTLRGVFDPEEALRREELPFFAFGHPDVDRLVDYSATQGPATGARSDPEVTGLLIEVYVHFEGDGSRPLGVMKRYTVGEDLEVAATDLSSIPDVVLSTRVGVEIPPWAGEAVDGVRAAVGQDLEVFRAEVSAVSEQQRSRELDRLDRILRYRRERLQHEIDRAEEWIARVEAEGTDDERRVLPARRGLLERRRYDLERVEEEQVERRRRIERREAHVSGQVVAAGLVVGEES